MTYVISYVHKLCLRSKPTENFESLDIFTNFFVEDKIESTPIERLVEAGRPYRNDAMWQLHEDLVAAAAWERRSTYNA